jgi:hypothetical protein
VTQIKGGKAVTRQNFSMHPDLMKAIFDTATSLSARRMESILSDRSHRVTYSKIVATLIYDAIERGLIQTQDGQFIPTKEMDQLVVRFEASAYELVRSAAEKRALEKGAFDEVCHLYGLRSEHYRRPFLWQGQRVSVVGFDAKMPEQPLIVEEEATGHHLALSFADFRDAPWAPVKKAKTKTQSPGEVDDEANEPGGD